MKFALISPEESGRIVDVALQEFEVAPPLFWVECADDAKPETHYFDALTVQVLPIPVMQPTHADLVDRVLAKARQQRHPIMGVLDGLQTSALVTGDTVLVNGVTTPLAEVIEWSKQSLRDITTTDLSACTTQAEMELAIYQAYQAIAAAAPPSVQTAFQSLVP